MRFWGSFPPFVEVGTPVARCPPHRSRRAVFPHRALQFNSLSQSPGHQTERQQMPRSSPLSLPQVPWPELPRIRQGKCPLESLGGRLPPPTAHQGCPPAHRRPGSGLQMAAHHLALLAGPQTLRGENLRSRTAQSQQPLGGPARQNPTRQKPLQNTCEKE